MAASESSSSSAATRPITTGIAVTSDIIDIDAFEKLRQELERDDGIREIVIKRSRDVLKMAKTAIYCVHRKQLGLAETNLDQAQEIARTELLPLAEKHPQLRWGGALSGALEEYAEGVIFYHYMTTGKVPGPDVPRLADLVTRDEFLGGVMDFVGEVTRVAVLSATARDEDAVARAKNAVEDVQLAMMSFDWKNGSLRRKYDGIKYSLKKLEQITYEMSLTKALGGIAMASREVPTEAEPDAEPADGDAESEGRSAGASGGRGRGRGSGRSGSRGRGRGSGRGAGRSGGARPGSSGQAEGASSASSSSSAPSALPASASEKPEEGPAKRMKQADE